MNIPNDYYFLTCIINALNAIAAAKLTLAALGYL